MSKTAQNKPNGFQDNCKRACSMSPEMASPLAKAFALANALHSVGLSGLVKASLGKSKPLSQQEEIKEFIINLG